MTEELNGGCLDEREAFEAHANKRALRAARGLDNSYRYIQTDEAWEAWQARASLSTSKQAAAEPVEYLRAVGDGTHELVGKHERGAFPVYATPPAVMPAAPSDAQILSCFADSKAEGQGAYMLAVGRAILALSQTMQPQAGAVAGWQLVPTRPTDAMTWAGQQARYPATNSITVIYNAMLAAAPSAAIAAREQEDASLDVLLAKFHGAVWEAATNEAAPVAYDLAGVTECKAIQAHVRRLYVAAQTAYELLSDGTPVADKDYRVVTELAAALTQPTTVQQAEPTDVQMEQIADAIWGAQKKRLPMSAAIEFARAILALKTAQTTALPGGNGEGK